jgi:DNA-binding CsgD family transcriptional regulator
MSTEKETKASIQGDGRGGGEGPLRVQGSATPVLSGSISPLAILGAGFFWLWMDSAVFSDALSSLAEDGRYYEWAFIVTTLFTVISIALLIGHFHEFATIDSRFHAECIALSVIGCAGGFVQIVASSLGSVALMVIGAACNGIYFGYFNIVWGWVCVAQGHSKAIIHICAAWSLSLPFNLLLTLMPDLAAGILVSLLPVFSFLVLLVLWRSQDSPRYRIEPVEFRRVELEGKERTFKNVDARLLILILAFCMVFGLMYFYQMLSPDIVGASSGSQVIGVRGLTALVFLVASVTVFRDRVSLMFQTCLVVLIIGLAALMIAMFAPVLRNAASMMIAVGYCGFDVLVWTMIAYHSYVSPNPPTKTIAVTMLAEQVGILAGALLGLLFASLELEPTASAFAMMLIEALVVAALVSFTGYGSHLWNMLTEASASINVSSSEAETLARFSKDYGLSKRESEVLSAFATGRSMSNIAERLYVSENTVKTHVRHIYKKCGVNGKQDLLDLIEDYQKEGSQKANRQANLKKE